MKRELLDYTGYRRDQLEAIQTFYIAKANHELPDVPDDNIEKILTNLGAVTLRLESLDRIWLYYSSTEN